MCTRAVWRTSGPCMPAHRCPPARLIASRPCLQGASCSSSPSLEACSSLLLLELVEGDKRRAALRIQHRAQLVSLRLCARQALPCLRQLAGQPARTTCRDNSRHTRGTWTAASSYRPPRAAANPKSPVQGILSMSRLAQPSSFLTRPAPGAGLPAGPSPRAGRPACRPAPAHKQNACFQTPGI